MTEHSHNPLSNRQSISAHTEIIKYRLRRILRNRFYGLQQRVQLPPRTGKARGAPEKERATSQLGLPL